MKLASSTPTPTLGSLVARLEREVTDYEKKRDEQIEAFVRTIEEIGQDCARAVQAVTAGRALTVASTSDPDDWFVVAKWIVRDDAELRRTA